MDGIRADVSPGVVPAESVLDRLAAAVHTAAHWVPPWPDPIELVVAAGFELVLCTPVTGPPRGRRRVGVEWHPDDRVRGLRVLRAFAAVLLREVVGEHDPAPAIVDALAGRLLIPAAMLAAARRTPEDAERHAPRDFVRARLCGASVTESGVFAAVLPPY